MKAMLTIAVLVVLTVAQILVWLFGLRPYVHSRGKPCVTAARFGLSMLADWTTAWEAGKESGRVPLCAQSFLLLLIAQIVAVMTLFV